VIGSASETCPSSDIDEGLRRAILLTHTDGSKAALSSPGFLGFVGHFLATSMIEQGQTTDGFALIRNGVENKRKAASKGGSLFDRD
jgi:hypothetical protein